MMQTFKHLSNSQMMPGDKEKSKKVIKLWKSGKIYPPDFLDGLEKVMDKAPGDAGVPIPVINLFILFWLITFFRQTT
jgi:hypothetical protein